MLQRAAPLIAGAAGLLSAFYPALLSGFDQLQIGPIDPRLVNYVLEHSYLWLLGDPLHASFWDPPVFYPASNVGAYTDTLLGAAPLYWLWRAAGCGPGAAFQLWMMLCLSLNFAAAHILLRRCVGLDAWVAASGAFLYGFGAPRLASFNSPQLFPVFYGSFALCALGLALGAATRARRAAWTLACMGALVLQAWSAFYPSFFLALILAIALAVSVALPELRVRLRAFAAEQGAVLALGGVAAAAALWPLLAAHLAAAGEVGWRDYADVARSLPRPGSWVFPGRDHWLYAGLARWEVFAFDSPEGSHSNGVGFATSALCVAGLVLGRRRALVRVVLATTAATLLLTSALPGGLSLWSLVYDALPPARAIRYVARVGAFLLLPAALGLGLLLQHLVAGGRTRLALACAVVAALEQGHVLQGFSQADYRRSVERVAAAIDPTHDAFLLATRSPTGTAELGDRPGVQVHVLAMWAGLRAGVPTLNGFYGNRPRGWWLQRIDADSPQRHAALERALASWLELQGVEHARIGVVWTPLSSLPRPTR